MKVTVPEALAGERIDRVIALLTGRSRAEVAAMVAGGAVLLAGSKPQASRRLSAGEVIEVDLPETEEKEVVTGEAGIDFEVVLADRDVIVVDKPAGLVVHPGPGNRSSTLVNGLLHRFPDLASAQAGDPMRPGIVHRLDKGTSGLLVVARTADAYRSLIAQMKSRTVERTYVALALGVLESDRGVIDAPIGRSAGDRTAMALTRAGRAARTRYEVLQRFSTPLHATLVECKLDTGRTHQIRVHLASIGHPVVGDARYGAPMRRQVGLSRPFLHAHRLAFDHPRSGERVECVSELPTELSEVLSRFS